MRARDGTAPRAALEYMPQLDGLRALAVTAVVTQHFNVFSRGAGYGVHLFFVLSGFLITGILLAARREVVDSGMSRVHAFRQFYARRVLRIFPLYYAVVIVGIIFNIPAAREYAPWLLTYTLNLKMAVQGWYVPNFAHFWSLSIEEQYYLVWPWLILTLPRRALVPVALATTAIGPLFRLWAVMAWTLWHSDMSPVAGYIATPAALDSIGMGSLLAILMTSQPLARRLEGAMRWPVPVASLALVVLLEFTTNPWFHLVLVDTAAAAFFCWLVYKASRGFSGVIGWLLGLSAVVFVGRISYGIYVYHPLVMSVVESAAPRLGVALPRNVWAAGLIYSTMTLALATISWYAFERPINNLKRKFPYSAGKSSHGPVTLDELSPSVVAPSASPARNPERP
jgi:peptidoglycan/LPS O-acetylase OafA/YrhL